MNSPASVLEQVVPDLRELLSADAVGALSNAERVQLLAAAGEVQRLLDAIVVETVAAADLDCPGSAGCRSMNDLLQRTLRTDAAGAARVVTAGRAVHRPTGLSSGAALPALWPRLGEALREGVIGLSGLLAATGPVHRAGRRIGPEDRMRADVELAAFARGVTSGEEHSESASEPLPAAPPATPEDLRLLATVMVTYLDPDGAEPAEDIALRARGVALGPAKGGVVPIHGSLLPETAAQLQRIWDAFLNPKVGGPPLPGVAFRPTDEIAPSDDAPRLSDDAELPADDPGRLLDTRSRAQRQHDALAAALGIAARHDDMPRLGGAAPTLIVSVSARDYATGRGWAHVEGIDTPVAVGVARHTACGGTVQRVLFDPHGRVIGLGTTDRIFTTAQRRAIAARDGECLIPGCHVPASWCEIHHVTEHARGGPTHTDNGVALCWHHHRTLETSGWEIRMTDGVPQVRGPAWWDRHRRWRTPRHLIAGVRRRAG